MKNGSFIVHFSVALVVSYAISLGVWAVLDIYHPTAFWIVSSAAALIGALTGWATGKFLATTLTATLIVRSAVLFLAIGG